MKWLTSPCTLLARSTYCDPCRCAWGETQSSVSGSAHPSLRRAQGPPRPLLTQEHGSLPRMKPGHAPPLPSLEPLWSRWLRLVLQGVDSAWNQTLVREHRPGRTDGWMDGQTVVWMRGEQVNAHIQARMRRARRRPEGKVCLNSRLEVCHFPAGGGGRQLPDTPKLHPTRCAWRKSSKSVVNRSRGPEKECNTRLLYLPAVVLLSTQTTHMHTPTGDSRGKVGTTVNNIWRIEKQSEPRWALIIK